MKKLFTLFAVVGLAAACGNADTAACNAYSDHVEGLSCIEPVEEPAEGEGEDDVCETTGEGCAEYWDCLTANSLCDGDTPDFAGTVDCDSTGCL